MKIRITKNDNEEELYDMFMNVLSDKFHAKGDDVFWI